MMSIRDTSVLLQCDQIMCMISDLSRLVRTDLLLVLLPSLPSAATVTTDKLIVKTDEGIFSRLDIVGVCKNMLLIIEQGFLGLDHEQGSSRIVGSLIDITDSQVVDFLLVTLPILTEAFLKRRTRGEHEAVVTRVLLAVSKLLAQPASHDLLELCELRNMLLSGGNTHQMKFIDSKTIQAAINSQSDVIHGSLTVHNIWDHLSRDGFFGHFGRPVAIVIGSRTLVFWPDDWAKVVGGFRALGHFVQWFDEDGSDAIGQVIGFIRRTDEYLVQRVDGQNAMSSSVDKVSSSMLNNTPCIALHLKTTKHNWVDLQFRQVLVHRLGDSLLEGRLRVGDPFLEYNDLLDRGRFVRMWWTRYKRYFYGRVVRYDSVSKTHLICYEDGDHRSYEMFTRDYEVVVIPRDSDIDKILADKQCSDHEAAKLVAQWHMHLQATNDNETRSDGSSTDVTPPSSSTKDGSKTVNGTFTLERPSATCATALSISQIQIAVVNEYLRSGGPDSLFQSLVHADSASSSSSCRLLHVHLHFLQLLKLILCFEDPSAAKVQRDPSVMTGPQYFSELLWEFKESLPCALLRFEDAQMKDVDMRDLTDLLFTLQNMIVVDSQYAEVFADKKRVKLLSEGFDLLRLDMVLKLLACSQIQKRYNGLVVIKETVFSIMPKLEPYLVHRQKVLGLPRGGSKQPVAGSAASRNNYNNSRIALPPGSIDAWLVEKGIVEMLFGESLHHDLIAKSDCVIAYMASRKLLTEKHLAIIWQASLGVHEAVVRVLHSLMLIVVPILDPALRMYLFSLMSALQSWEFTEQILQLIASYTVQSLIAFRDESANLSSSAKSSAAMDESSAGPGGAGTIPSAAVGASLLSRRGLVMSSSQRQWMGFGVLWQFVQDPNLSAGTNGSSSSSTAQGKCKEKESNDRGGKGVHEGLVDVAVQLLVELLQDEFKDDRELVMQRCLENMKYGISVPVSLQILRRTLALYPLTHKSWFALGRQPTNKTLTAGYQIEKLIKNSQLLDVLFRDLDSFHKNMVSLEQAQQPTTSGIATGSNIRKAPSFIDVAQSAQINESRMQLNGKFSRVSHLKAVGERLDFLQFIISWSSVKLNEAQTSILWNAFAEETPTLETLEKFVLWLHGLLNKEHRQLIIALHSLCMEGDHSVDSSNFSPLATLLSSFSAASLASKSADADAHLMDQQGKATSSIDPVSTFEEGVLVKLFEGRVLKWVDDADRLQMLSRWSVAALCIKLFLLVNISGKAIRVESDGSWYCVGPLSGLKLMWRLALDATDDQVSSACISLLVELHHRVAPSNKTTARSIDNVKKGMFFTCFKHLYLSIQSLQAGEEQVEPTDQAGPRQIVADGQAGDWFDDGEALLPARVIATRIKRLVISLRSFVYRYYVAPSKLYNVKVLVGREESLAFTLRINAADKLGYLRFKVAEHFKEPADSILLYKASTHKTSSSNSSVSMMGLLSNASDLLDRDDLSLQLTLAGDLSVVVKRKEASPDSQQSSPANSGDHAHQSAPLKDLFAAEDLSRSLLRPLQPLQWLYSSTAGSASVDTVEPSEGTSHELFTLPPNYLSSSIQNLLRIRDVDLVQKDVLSGVLEHKTPYSEVCKAADAHYADVTEQLSAYFGSNAMFLDHLIEMLDGYLSTVGSGSQLIPADSTDLSAAVWDLLQSLPPHAGLQGQVEAAKAVLLSRLLNRGCPYRMLYTLQIVEQCLLKDGGLDWAIRFFQEGGAEHVVQLLNDLLLKESVRQEESATAEMLCGTSSSSAAGLPRCDVNAMNISMLARTTHYLLSLDVAYVTWQSVTPKFQSNKRSINEFSSANLPIGIVMSSIDLNALVTNTLHATLNMAQLWKSSQLSGAALEAVCDNTLLLLFNLLAASDDAATMLRSSDLRPLLERWVCGLCVQCDAAAVRETTCRRLFEACANTFQKCANPRLKQDHKRARLQLFDFLLEVTTAIAVDAPGEFAVSLDSNGGELFSLLAALEALRSAPYLVFPQISSKGKASRFVYSDGADSPSDDATSPSMSSAVDLSVDGVLSVSVPGSSNNNSLFMGLVTAFADKFGRHRSVENFHSLHSDGVLVGILRMLLVLASIDEEQRVVLGCASVAAGRDVEEADRRLIPYLYKHCLFPTGREAVCQTERSRSIVFALLHCLCHDTADNLRLLVTTMRDCPSSHCDAASLLKRFSSRSLQPYPLWDYNPNAVMKEAGAFVGLSNQGATCYMNSFVQQLFHIPAFTDGLLRISSTTSTSAGPSTNQTTTAAASTSKEHESMLFQLQVMFGFMKLSQKRFYDTLPFCLAFKDYDGSSIRLNEQKDINEFAGMLFEQLEHRPEGKRLLADTIQGTIVWKTSSIETDYRSEREEHFYMLTAEVKDKVCLEDSLELFTAAELFSGDNKIEDAEGRKVDALRRCAIRSLPPTLIIHLKRFEFDLETLDRKKVNDLISFPTDLNMFPYTEEGLLMQEESLKMPASSLGGDRCDFEDEAVPDEAVLRPATIERKEDAYYQYTLKGVVAHVGAIDRGHYYSFIKDRTSGTWLEFNDRKVVPFSEEAIPSECFGGRDEFVDRHGMPCSRVRENNAYLLVYERVDCVSALSHGQSFSTASMDQHVFEAISTENQEFQRDKFLFDATHFAFMWQLPSAAATTHWLAPSDIQTETTPDINSSHPEEQETALAHLVLAELQFVVQVLSRARAHECVSLFFDRIQDLVRRDRSCRCGEAVLRELTVDQWHHSFVGAIKTNEDLCIEKLCHPWLVAMLVQCPFPDTVKAFLQFLFHAVVAVRPNQLANYLQTDAPLYPAELQSCVEPSLQHLPFRVLRHSTSKLVDSLVFILQSCNFDCNRSCYFYISMFLFQFASMGSEEMELLVQINGISRLVQSVMRRAVHPHASELTLQYAVDTVMLLVAAVYRRRDLFDAKALPRFRYLDHGGIPLLSDGSIGSIPADPQAVTSPAPPHEQPIALCKDFFNRTFLEVAVYVSPGESSSTLRRVYESRGSHECGDILEFLLEHIALPTTNAAAAHNAATNKLNFRSYFKVLSDILLGPGLSSINTYQPIILKLLNKTRPYATRAGPSDAVFVSAVCGLLYQIGLSSSPGHVLVMKLKDSWKDLHHSIASAKRLPPTSIGGAMEPCSGGTADASIDTARFSFDR